MKLEKVLRPDNINHNLFNIQYAVRGPIVHRAAQIEQELERGVRKPFERVVWANLGDCHAMGQKPITFVRQVVSIAANPSLLSCPAFPDDVKARARDLLKDCKNQSVGSYSMCTGLRVVRTRVAEFLSARDGVPADPDQIYLGAGASDLIKAVLHMFVEDVDGKPPAVMLPVPQYPLFSGTLAELGLRQVDYCLDEDSAWALRPEELDRCWREASAHCNVRVIVIINPGNPTGQVMTRETIEDIVKFAFERKVFILADEVYQENVINKPFISVRKVLHEMGAPYCQLEVGSLASSAKGLAAECGLRGAYVELRALLPAVAALLGRARSLLQCPPVLGQCTLLAAVNPPSPGEPSYKLYSEEVDQIRQLVRERTKIACDRFNSIPGMSCIPIEAAMYAFPRVEIPELAREVARERGISPDELYCYQLLEETGVCVVAGCGFGQPPGTYHFRATLIHPWDQFCYMMDAIETFHRDFLERFSQPK